MELSVWDEPRDHQLFDDSDYWLLPDEGFPEGKTTNELVDGIHIEQVYSNTDVDTVNGNVENTDNAEIVADKV